MKSLTPEEQSAIHSAAFTEASAAGFGLPLPLSDKASSEQENPKPPSAADRARALLEQMIDDPTIPAETRRKAALDLREIDGCAVEKPKVHYDMNEAQREFLTRIFSELGAVLGYDIPGQARLTGTGTLGATRPGADQFVLPV